MLQCWGVLGFFYSFVEYLEKNWPFLYFPLPVSFQTSQPLRNIIQSCMAFSQPCQNFSDLVDAGFFKQKKPSFDVFLHHYVRVASGVRQTGC